MEWIVEAETLADLINGRFTITTKPLIRCKDCIYKEQDEDDQYYCRSFGCQVGDSDGSGFCSDGDDGEKRDA